MKVCNKCNKSKEEDEFNTYWHSTFKKHYTRGYCIECEYKKKNEYKRRMREVMNNPDDYWGATGDDYLKNPNEYIDENQRLSVFRVMKLLGWKFNQNSGIWYKEPLKLKDGTFPNLKKFERPHNRSIKTETINQIREFFKEGHKVHQIAKMCNVHPSTAYRYCHSDLNYKKNKYIPKKKRNDSIE
jgi:hypothetical protein